MAGIAVKGTYRNGIVELTEDVSARDGAEVLVVFEEQSQYDDPRWLWDRIKAEITKEHPDLLEMTDEEIREEFDRLSEQIAENMPYKTLEEFERAMRGDEFGLARYEHLCD